MIAPWWEEAEQLCRTLAAPELDSAGCYVVAAEDLPPDATVIGAHAFTSPFLAHALEPWLTSRCRWQGEGFATIVKLADFPNESAAIGISLHELAHHLCYESLRKQFPHEPPAIPQAELWAAAFAPHVPPAELWEGHGVPFIRAALHLAHRLKSLPARRWMGIESLRVAGEGYGLSSCYAYSDALGNETSERSGEPITAILASEPPAEFAELFRQDVERWQLKIANAHNE